MDSVWMTAAHLFRHILLFLLLLPDLKSTKSSSLSADKATNFLINADVSILTIALLSFKDSNRSISVDICFSLTCAGELRMGRENEAAFVKEIFFSALHYKAKLKQVGMTEFLMLLIGGRSDLGMCDLFAPASTFSFSVPPPPCFCPSAYSLYTVTVPHWSLFPVKRSEEWT